MPRRLFTAVVWLLVALWLPAVLHCTAETAGVFDGVGCGAGDFAPALPDNHCAAVECEVIESGVPRDDGFAVLSAISPLVVLQILRTPLGVLAASSDLEVSPAAAAPPEIVRLWRAVERVVALAQAP